MGLISSDTRPTFDHMNNCGMLPTEQILLVTYTHTYMHTYTIANARLFTCCCNRNATALNDLYRICFAGFLFVCVHVILFTAWLQWL